MRRAEPCELAVQERWMLIGSRWVTVMDDAFAEIGKVPRGDYEVAVVVEHDEVMVYCRGANQQVHG